MPISEPRIVKGHGAEDAQIMIVCDYPSHEEFTSGKAGTGYVERRFRNLFHDAGGYSYDRTYVSHIYKHEFHLPKGKKLQDQYVADYEKAFLPNTYGQILSEEIAEIKPNVIVAAGEYALRYLTGRQQILKQRGSILPLSEAVSRDAGSRAPDIAKHIRVIPVIHPRDIVLKELHHSYSVVDFKRIVKYSTRTDVHKDDSLLWICWTIQELSNWWERARKGKFLTVDIETYHGFITCIGFSHDGHEAVSVPLLDRRMSSLDRGLILAQISRILQSPIRKINQNIFYDDWELTNWGWLLNNIDGDTMWLAHTLYPELPRDLGFLTSLYTEIPYYKDEGHNFHPRDGFDTLYYYNAKDALSTWSIYEAQERDARESGIWSFYREQVWPLYEIYKRQAHRGICIDTVEQSSLLRKYEGMLSDRHQRLTKLVGYDINFNAPKQICELIYNQLKYEKMYKVDRNTGKKSLTSGEETVEELILNYSQGEVCDEILWNILWCRKLFKIIKLIKVPFHLDGRMRSFPKITGTKSGRSSFSRTVDRLYFQNTKKHPLYIKGSPNDSIMSRNLGLSFQTIGKHGFVIQAENDEEEDEFSTWDIQGITVGKDIRKMYIPSEGYVFIEGDGGQAEARVVCVLAEDWDALAEMNRKEFKRNAHRVKDDLHTKTAMLVLNKRFEEITDQDRQDFGKKPRHAGNYDMGPNRLALMAHTSITQAQTTLTRFHANSPLIRENFHSGIRSAVSNTRQLETPHGRVSQFLGKLTQEYFKEAFSRIPQATVSDHTKFTTVRPLCEKWTDDRAYFLAESHDSGFFEVRKKCVDEFCEDFVTFGETPISFRKGTFVRDVDLVIPIELKMSDTNWYEMKEIK